MCFLFNFTFFMKRMFFVPFAILHKLQLPLHIPSILLRRIISSVTFRTLKRNFFNCAFFLTCHIYKLPCY